MCLHRWPHKRDCGYTSHSGLGRKYQRSHDVLCTRRRSSDNSTGGCGHDGWVSFAHRNRSIVDNCDSRLGVAAAAAVNRCSFWNMTIHHNCTSIQSLCTSRSRFDNTRCGIGHHRTTSTGGPRCGMTLSGCHARSSRCCGPGCSIHARTGGPCTVNDTSMSSCT